MRPDVEVELKDSLELDEDGEGVKPILGNGGGGFWTARY
jgi:hypothetical protein